MTIAEENQKVLKDFYDVIKSLDPHLRAIFITGVTKFAKTSLFSGFNNLRDISESPQFATLLGYTEHEISIYFSNALQDFSRDKNISLMELRKEMNLSMML